MGADLLLADIDSFTLDLVTTTKTKKIPVKQMISLADRFPMAFDRLRRRGACTFETELADFDRAHPGLYLAKLRNVEVVFVGLTGATPIAGTLRNVGVSRSGARTAPSSRASYPADVMVLSQYEIRAGRAGLPLQSERPAAVREQRHRDAVAARPAARRQRLRPARDPRRAARPVLRRLLQIRARGDSARGAAQDGQRLARLLAEMMFPDELFYLRTRARPSSLFDAGMFPRKQKNFKRTQPTLKDWARPARTSCCV